MTGDFYFASHCFSSNNQEHPRKGTVEGRGGGGPFISIPIGIFFETRNDGQHRRDKLAGRRLAYSTMTHNERIHSRPRGFSSKRLPPCRCDRACRVCTGRLINIGRISERARKAKRFFPSLVTRSSLSPRREAIVESRNIRSPREILDLSNVQDRRKY